NGYPLRVIGSGPLEASLRKKAPAHIRFSGHVPDDELRRALGEARALVFPGKEDFGLVPVEALAAGTPVVALWEGGARDWMGSPVGKSGRQLLFETGVGFRRETSSDLQAAIDAFLQHEGQFTRSACRQRAVRFSRANFRRKFRSYLSSMAGITLETS
ncbi:MAG: glycosyltransferase, partial [Candidatus Neomarinimicrobiota bacterium]